MTAISILITGANGQVGKALQEASARHPDKIFHFYSRESLDISDEKALELVMRQCSPDILINAAAYTAVDKAESEGEKAYLVNEKAVEILADKTSKNGIPLLHLSTDYVYHNGQTRPLLESDPTEPAGVYASSKFAGEKAARKTNGDTYIIRTSWVYGVYGHNFVKTMLRLGMAGRPLKVVDDQVGSPTNAHDLAEALIEIAPKILNKELPPGVYNYCNSGKTSWYELAKTVFEVTGIETELDAIPTSAYPTPASRPPYSVLNTEKISRHLTNLIPEWDTSLRKYLSRIARQVQEEMDQKEDS